MDDSTAARVLEKAAFVASAVEILAEKRDSLSFDTYREDREQRDVVEREFQTAIEACIDIGTMLLVERDEEVPETKAAIFRQLGETPVLDEELAERMAQAAGFRNVLAHTYGNDVDDRDVYNVLQHELPIFREFLEAVRETVD